ncbi:F0F1 ATP synthase subunit [Parazoarcus communis]|uniref:F0F1 ATP synthase subunit n=1 Tax=Parazoarcus communis TaxID=41977 RepID=A0A2U8GM27_9RHOO|nr:AtpZ/AtpI family protein [Parazoarcus communis]AWI74659.1 F0F1 ATP synthase subunit [Parazoarcus communis]|tara:strand:- start:4650 stop:4994 length:345 start_codon:yes stop_codon:yes gene_type:complete
MSEERKIPTDTPERGTEFTRQVERKVARKLKAKRQVTRTIWFGLGMMGLVGWSVAVPVLVGVGFGFWLDANYPVGHSWTLMLMPIGLILGCFNAWRWISREGSEIREQEEEGDE